MRRICFLILLMTLSLFGVSAQTDTPPEKADDNLIIAFYNIKWLGNRQHDYEALAKIISQFDVCVVLEIKKETAFAELGDLLVARSDENWAYAHGPRSKRPNGRYFEAFGVIYNSDRVQLGQGVVSNIWDEKEIYRNDPFYATFNSDFGHFTLLGVHTRYNDDAYGSRLKEVSGIPRLVKYLREKLNQDAIIVGGDFNYTADNPHLRSSMARAKLESANVDSKTTFSDSSADYVNDYDHIFVSKTLKPLVAEAGALDVTSWVFGEKTAQTLRRSHDELSDHLPVFVVLQSQVDPDTQADEE